jgi:hypothetical protein
MTTTNTVHSLEKRFSRPLKRTRIRMFQDHTVVTVNILKSQFLRAIIYLDAAANVPTRWRQSILRALSKGQGKVENTNAYRGIGQECFPLTFHRIAV